MKLKYFIISIILFSLSLSQEKIPPTYMASFGSVTINDKLYNQISFKPEFTMGKVGLGLDFYFYFDEDGNIYDENWDFSTPEASLKTILDKIYYIRYGMPTDTFYFKIGALPKQTIGHGILVSNYANDIDYPQTRRVGFDFRYTFSGFRLEVLHSNVKEPSSAGLFGLRTVFPLVPNIDMGFAVVTDLDQNSGLPDSDNDSFPDDWDDFPNDGTLSNYYQSMIQNLQEDFNCTYYDENDSDCPQGINSTIFEYNEMWNQDIAISNLSKDNVSGISLDLTYKISDKVRLFSEFAQLTGDTKNPYPDNTIFNTNLGYGFIPIGLEATFNAIKLTIDYRQSSENFIFHYWDKNYEHNRAMVSIVNEDQKEVVTKESLLYQFGKQKGGSFGFIANISKYLRFSVNYLYLRGDKWDSSVSRYVSDKNNSFYSKFEIDTSMIPKVEIAEIFYQQTNTANPLKFKNNENTLFGYNIGITLANNLALMLKGRKTYVLDHETGEYNPVKNTQIETSLYF
ncbi:MAG: hypothetical protein CMG66_00380 [Candidatus Marinimicrobia bacterium]|nr:hypothetical protein [Candidatus Neomarinimicrobiota bacterium]|tara:strand:- start:9952 stop:11481 length:1530 start_codon:yes stop_codon:yes gene_type:complete